MPNSQSSGTSPGGGVVRSTVWQCIMDIWYYISKISIRETYEQRRHVAEEPNSSKHNQHKKYKYSVSEELMVVAKIPLSFNVLVEYDLHQRTWFLKLTNILSDLMWIITIKFWFLVGYHRLYLL
jgi:hypothetical protein